MTTYILRKQVRIDKQQEVTLREIKPTSVTADLRELKSMAHPPVAIRDILQAVFILLGERPSWCKVGVRWA